MANRPNKGPKTPSVSIKEVRIDQFGRSGNIFTGRIAGKAFRGNDPAEGVNIHFSVGGIKTPNSPLQTEATGEVTDDFSIPLDPSISRVLIEARMDWGTPARRMIDLPITPGPSAPKPKPPIDKLGVNSSGRNGQYVISAVVSAENKSPIDGITVVFLEGGNEYRETTKDGGVASCKISFTEKVREVTVQTAGLEPETLRLLGPTKTFIPPLEEKLGFFRSIRAGIRAGLKAKRDRERNQQ